MEEEVLLALPCLERFRLYCALGRPDELRAPHLWRDLQGDEAIALAKWVVSRESTAPWAFRWMAGVAPQCTQALADVAREIAYRLVTLPERLQIMRDLHDCHGFTLLTMFGERGNVEPWHYDRKVTEYLWRAVRDNDIGFVRYMIETCEIIIYTFITGNRTVKECIKHNRTEIFDYIVKQVPEHRRLKYVLDEFYYAACFTNDTRFIDHLRSKYGINIQLLEDHYNHYFAHPLTGASDRGNYTVLTYLHDVMGYRAESAKKYCLQSAISEQGCGMALLRCLRKVYGLSRSDIDEHISGRSRVLTPKIAHAIERVVGKIFGAQ